MKVLLGIGGTDDSLDALEKTVARTVEANDDLTVGIIDNPAADLSPDEVEAHVREVLAEAGLDADVRQIQGDPGSRLVEICEHEQFEKIVLGGGETSPMGKINLGSVAEFVLLNSHVTVSLVR